MPDFRPALLVVGVVLVILSTMMTFPVIFLSQHTDWFAFVVSASLSLLTGMFLALRYRRTYERLGTREMFLVTLLSWLSVSAFSALPFLLSEFRMSVTDAVFESVSGVTTTGSTVLSGLEYLPRDILLWRSLLQWLGGIGIIGMAVAVLPFLRVGGMRLFRTESSDMSDKAVPRARTLVKGLVFAYLILSLLCALMYELAGMSWFDAINHAMTTISTGGYSTWDASMGHFQSETIEWIAVTFMICGGIPFVLYVRFWSDMKGEVFNIRQVRGFILVLAAASGTIAVVLMTTSEMHLFEALTAAVFNVTSIVTTTGYSSTDYAQWGTAAVSAFFFLTFVGGCSGSTSGGMKIFRFQLSFILLREQIRKLVHPHAVSSQTYDEVRVTDEIIASAIAFSFLFFASLAIMTLLLALLGLDLTTALSGSATALANVGPGLGTIIGPSGNFQALPDAAKWILCGGMILGRLELVVVLVVFTRSFWRG